MPGIENLLARGIRALVPRDYLSLGDHFDPIHVTFDSYRLKRPRPRYTVAVTVKGHRLILVHLPHFTQAGIETVHRQCECGSTFGLKTLTNRLALATDRALPLCLAAVAKMRV